MIHFNLFRKLIIPIQHQNEFYEETKRKINSGLDKILSILLSKLSNQQKVSFINGFKIEKKSTSDSLVKINFLSSVISSFQPNDDGIKSYLIKEVIPNIFEVGINESCPLLFTFGDYSEYMKVLKSICQFCQKIQNMGEFQIYLLNQILSTNKLVSLLSIDILSFVYSQSSYQWRKDLLQFLIDSIIIFSNNLYENSQKPSDNYYFLQLNSCESICNLLSRIIQLSDESEMEFLKKNLSIHSKMLIQVKLSLLPQLFIDSSRFENVKMMISNFKNLVNEHLKAPSNSIEMNQIVS